MRSLRIKFENYAWRGLRLEGRLLNRSEGEPHEFSIEWHHMGKCWDIIEYSHFEEGPSKGKHTYVKTWEEVQDYFKEYSNNLETFRESVENYMAELVAEEV